MNKVLQSILILSILQISLILAADATCKTHDIFIKAQQFIKDAVSGNPTGQSKANTLLQTFQDSQPQILTAADLGVCSQFAGQKTCCNKDIVSFLDKAAFLKIGPLQTRTNVTKKFLNVIANLLKLSNCAKTQTIVVADLLGNSKFTKLAAFMAQQNKCKTDFAKAISQFTRGAMCSICAGVDKLSDYFSNGNLVISSDSASAFSAATVAATKCITDNFSSDTLTAVLNEIVTEYIDDSCKTQENIVSTITMVFSLKSANILYTEKDGSFKCEGTTVFLANEDCNTCLDGDQYLESRSDPAARLLRNLIGPSVIAKDAVIAESGVNVFISSTTDSKINTDGTSTVDFSESETNSSSSTSSLKLVFGAISLFVAILI